jgi:hypothetical protein
MPLLNEHEWVKNLYRLSKLYNEQRVHRDFQADEVYKFVEWVYKEYGYLYIKPELTNKTHGKS